MIKLNCKTCGKEFLAKSCRKDIAKYCSYKCYWKTLNGKVPWNKGIPWSMEIKLKISKTHTGKKLSKEHRKNIGKALIGNPHSGTFKKGENHHNWKGGMRKTSTGYRILYMPEHPFSDKQGYIREHRYMTECILGRFLNSKELIHHIDRNRENNLPENLYLFPNQATHQSYHTLLRYNLIKLLKSNLNSQYNARKPVFL